VSVLNHLLSPGPFYPHQNVSYAIVIANSGPSAANYVDTAFTLQNLRFVSASAVCRPSGCDTFANLAAHGFIRIDVQAEILDLGPFSYQSAVRHRGEDPRPDNNTSTEGGTAEPEPKPTPPVTAKKTDLAVQLKMGNAGQHHPGEVVGFVARLHNEGTATATNVRVVTTSINLVDVSVAGACAQLKCVTAPIPAGGVIELRVRGTIAAAGLFSATVSAHEAQRETNTANNSATASDIAVIKPPPPKAWWAVILATLTLAGLAVPLRHIWWRGRLKCRAVLDRHGRSTLFGQLPLAAPAVSLRTRLEAGQSMIDRSLPILKTEVRRA
jgi:hypothetical protein